MRRFLNVLVCICLFSCGESTRFSMELLSPSFIEMNETNLERQGFLRTPIDIPMYQKQNGDTTVYFDYSGSKPNTLNSKSWEFEVDDSFNINSIFDSENYTLINEGCNDDFPLIAIDNNSHFVYSIRFTEKDELIEVNITYYYQWL